VAKMKEKETSKRNNHDLEKPLEECLKDKDNSLSISKIYQKLLSYPDVLTVYHVSEIIGVSTKLTYKLLNEGKLKSLKIGRAFKIPKHFLLQYLNAVN